MATKTPAGRIKVILALLLLFGPALILVLISTRGCEHKFKVPDDFGPAIDYHFTDGKGREFTSKDFTDNVVLVTTLQLKCPDSCAVSFWHLDQHIFQPVRKSKKKLGSVRIISFVTDGKGNPVEDVSQVQEMMEDRVEGYDPNVWYVASGPSRELYDISNNDQTLLQQGDEYFGGEAFQELLLLLDKENHLRMVLPGNTEGLVRRMKEHVALIQKVYDKEKAKAKK
ncbi:MAG: cytochrome oxidase Cu insertion factor (SCO1/SenC/PrrC family) [Flavobacteriaceae bacterium]|jgi:cytochrome oxidase Cu insertion factor (SCO1/SenC/PrrC family)